MATGSNTGREVARAGRREEDPSPVPGNPLIKCLRLLRLPLDLVLLTLDTLRFTIYYVGRYEYYNKKPCVFCSPDPKKDDDRKLYCRPAVKYGNQWIFRILCPCAVRATGWPPRCREDDYMLSLRHVPRALAFVLLFWGLSTSPLYWRAVADPARAWVLNMRAGKPEPAPVPKPPPTVVTDVNAAKAKQYRERAAQFMELLHFEEALQALQRAEEIHPDDPRITLELSRCHEQLAQFDDALDYARRAHQADPDHLDGRLQLTRIHLQLNQLEEARGVLAAAVRESPENVEVHLAGTRIAFRAEDRNGIETGLKKATGLAKNAEELREIALVAIETGDWDFACETADQAVQLNRSYYPAAHTLTAALIQRGHADQAARAFKQTQELDPVVTETRLLQAELHRLQGRWLDALNDYQLIAIQDGRVHRAWYWHSRIQANTGYTRKLNDVASRLSKEDHPETRLIGLELTAYLLLSQQRSEQALTISETVIGEYPWKAEGYLLRAKAQYQHKRYAHAARAAMEALRRAPLHFEAGLLLGEAMSRNGDGEGARQRLKALHRDYPEQVEPLLVLADIHFRDQQTPEALKQLDIAAAVAPASSAVAYHAGRMLLVLNRREDDKRLHALAETLNQHVDPISTLSANEIPILGRVPDHAGYELLASLFFQKGKPDRALEMARRVSEISEQSPTGPYLEAMAQHSLGRMKEARSACLRSLRLDGRHPGARALLAKLPAVETP